MTRACADKRSPASSAPTPRRARGCGGQIMRSQQVQTASSACASKIVTKVIGIARQPRPARSMDAVLQSSRPMQETGPSASTSIPARMGAYQGWGGIRFDHNNLRAVPPDLPRMGSNRGGQPADTGLQTE